MFVAKYVNWKILQIKQMLCNCGLILQNPVSEIYLFPMLNPIDNTTDLYVVE